MKLNIFVTAFVYKIMSKLINVYRGGLNKRR